MSIEAFLNVDIQNDFCPDGALPVSEGDEVVEAANFLNQIARKTNQPIFASRDWHPETTTHFAQDGGIWPVHCVQGTTGAQFHPDLNLQGAVIVSKGMGETEDAYSAFEARDEDGILLSELLRRAKVETVNVFGLATDYCVKASALSAVKEGFITRFVRDASRAVDLQSGDGDRAIEEMRLSGVEIVKVNDIIPARVNGTIQVFAPSKAQRSYLLERPTMVGMD